MILKGVIPSRIDFEIEPDFHVTASTSYQWPLSNNQTSLTIMTAHTLLISRIYQGIGVGTVLMNAMKTLARRLHLARVWLSVFEGNTPAQRLYQKTGFEGCGRVPRWLQEGYIDEIFMTLRLD